MYCKGMLCKMLVPQKIFFYSRNTKVLLVLIFIHKKCLYRSLLKQKVCIVVTLFNPLDILGLLCIGKGRFQVLKDGWSWKGKRRESGNSKAFGLPGLLC